MGKIIQISTMYLLLSKTILHCEHFIAYILIKKGRLRIDNFFGKKMQARKQWSKVLWEIK